jgi:hypothetical protein
MTCLQKSVDCDCEEHRARWAAWAAAGFPKQEILPVFAWLEEEEED